MADGVKIKGKTFGQKKPPLSVTISGILDKYPDGQIFKEVIQNADDAGAKEVKFILDHRELPALSPCLVESHARPLLEHYCGPALLAYNNAVFTESNWEGIQNLQQSEKVKDPFKVGKFGIGFNSVYHITDLPVLVSGDSCGYFDPQEKLWKRESGKIFSLTEFQGKPEILEQFIGLCGFQDDVTKFPGTLFRFPLRKISSDLSEKTYEVRDVQALIAIFRKEMKYLLLFLRSVRSITITELSDTKQEMVLHSVSISGCHSEQRSFLDRIHSTFVGDYPYSVPAVISVENSLDVVVKDGSIGESQHHWLVVQQVGSTDPEVLEEAARQHVFPWVGTAIEAMVASDPPNRAGRLFCFLPMPCEATAPIPVHVNGTFALSDDRRSIKWPAEEMKNDSQAKWNKLLVEHCLPSCYVKLVLKLVEMRPALPSHVYMAWPDVEKVESIREWSGFLKPFFLELFEQAVVYSSVDNGCWIRVQDAVFVPHTDEIPSAVEKALLGCGVKVTTVTNVVYRAILGYRKDVTAVTPRCVRQVLKANMSTYQSFSNTEKLDLLRYCIKEDGISDLVGLELLPLINGEFTIFTHSSHNTAEYVYVCSCQFPKTLLPDCPHLLIDPDDISLHKQLEYLAEKEITQLRMLQASAVAKLLHQFMPSDVYSCNWLDDFWKWVKSQILVLFENLPLVPIGQNEAVRLSKLSRVVYLPEELENQCNSQLVLALERYQVKVARIRTHRYLSHPQLLDYLHEFNGPGLLDAISSSDMEGVSPSVEDATALQNFLTGHAYSDSHKDVLCQLSIFFTLQRPRSPLSISKIASTSLKKKAMAEKDSYGFKPEYVPRFPLVISHTSNQIQLLRTVSVEFITKVEFLCQVVFPNVQQHNYSEQVTKDLLQETLDDFSSLICSHKEASTLLVDSLKTLPFLKNCHGQWKCLVDLFDPSDSDLCNLFEGEPVFPIAPFNNDNYIRALRICGLRQVDSITAQEILDIVFKIKTVVSAEPVSINATQYKRAKAVVKLLNNHPRWLQEECKMQGKCTNLKSALETLAHESSWLPVCSVPPSCYPSCLQWKGTNYCQHLCSSSSQCCLVACHADLGMAVSSSIMGTSAVFVEGCLPLEISKSLSCSCSSRTLAIINHLQMLILQKDDMDCDDLETIVKQIYAALDQMSSGDLHALSSVSEWIWVGGKTFTDPSSAALMMNPDFDFRYTLEPFVYIIPTSLTRYKVLFTKFDVEERVSSRQILSVLKKDLKVVSSSNAWSLVKAILEWATELCSKDNSVLDDLDLHVPIDSTSEYPELKPVKELVYTDNEFLKSIALSSGEKLTLVHSSVSASIALSLGVTPLSTHLDISEDIMEDAGQHEPLIQRLKNILREYKDGLTIIKELLQNADDAGATELNILYDARHHSTNNLFFPRMDQAHGPGLVVHNDASFTDKDFANITKLAGATKEDPLKIGKFGLGFCSVYHITDVPSFVSRDYLYIFDPALNHLAEAVQDRSKPGKRVKFTSPHLARSQQLSPYINLFDFQPSARYSGTMFRFPFRKFTSQISSVVYDDETVDELKESLLEEGSKLLLFLNNVKRITFSTIRDQEHNVTQHIVLQSYQECTDLGAFWKTIAVYQNGSLHGVKKWLISEHSQSIVCSGAELGKYSTAAVACHVIDNDSKSTVCKVPGEVFCFLPLLVQTGLPVHVSANFGVINNRRGIWTSDSSNIKGEKEVEWNLQLMKVTIAQAYVKLLKSLVRLSQASTINDYKFFSLWPIMKELRSKNAWDHLVAAVYDVLSEETLLYSKSIDSWLTLDNSQFLEPNLLSVDSHHSECVNSAVRYLQLPVVYLPPQYMSELHAFKGIQMSMIDQDEFVLIFFTGINSLESDIEVRNAVILRIFQVLSIEIDNSAQSPLKERLQWLNCIPCTPHGCLLKQARHLVFPSPQHCILFDPEDGRFPIQSFCDDPAACRGMMSLGLITESLPWELLVDCAKGIKELHKADRNKAVKRIQQILDCIHRNISANKTTKYSRFYVPDEARLLANIEFLPVLPIPEAYPFPWHGDSHRLLCGSKLVYHKEKAHSHSLKSNMPCLVGSQSAIIDRALLVIGDYCCLDETRVQELLGLHRKPKLASVLRHFHSVIQLYTDSTEELYSHDWVRKTCQAVYTFLDSELHGKEDKFACLNSCLESILKQTGVSEFPFIFTGESFVVPSLVAEKWTVNGPYLYSLPNSVKILVNLTEALKIRDVFETTDLLNALKSMYLDYSSSALPYDTVIDEILFGLNKHAIEIDTRDVFLPDDSYRLHKASELSYNDAPWCSPDAECVFVHRKVLRETALALGVKPIRNRFLEAYVSLADDEFESSFGQREELTDRIKNILHDYPLDATFLKELIQNADDAKATKMCVMLDKRTHGHEKVLSDHWTDLQGPALLVWNDTEFTENDLKGIQRLGLGSKRDDSESIGQFGIGFNVVYHITDCPSFITGGKTLCILDPHCRYAPRATIIAPGRRFDKLDKKFWDAFSDLKGAYLRDPLPGLPSELKGGSLFRFPLRHTDKLLKQSELVEEEVKEAKKPLSPVRLETCLSSWVPQVKDSLLFLNHLTQFQYFVISDESNIHCVSKFEVRIDDSHLKDRHDFCKSSKLFSLTSNPRLIIYPLVILDEQRQDVTEEKWLVQQGVGDIKNYKQQWSFIKQTVPKHGIAALLSTTRPTRTPFKGKVFCFLPLPIPSTNLPVHVNGQFVLNNSRRSLWNSDECDKKRSWNDNLIQAISSSYAQFLVVVQKWYVDSLQIETRALEAALDKYYQTFPYYVFPSEDELFTSEIRVPVLSTKRNIPEGQWKVLAKAVFKKLENDNSPVLASIDKVLNHPGEGTVRWCSPCDRATPYYQAYFIPDPCKRGNITPASLKELLVKIGMTITCAPHHIRAHFENAPPEATPENVFNFYNTFHERIVQGPVCHVSQTRFVSVNAFVAFTRYVSAPENGYHTPQYPDSPFGHQLLLTADIHLRLFDEDNKILSSEYYFLFPTSSSKFLHPDILLVCLPSDYFAEEMKYGEVLKVMQSDLSPQLCQPMVDNSNGALIHVDKLKDIWKCLCNDDVFKNHRQNILETFALLPSRSGYLYSTESSHLPLVPPREQSEWAYYSVSRSECEAAFELLNQLKMPVLDYCFCSQPRNAAANSDVKNVVENYCARMNIPFQVLESLNYFHHSEKVLDQLPDPDSNIDTLFDYFSKIHFRTYFNSTSLRHIMSLPLFKATNGKHISIQDKSVYIWPTDFCQAGYDKWADSGSVVFLEQDGAWRKLCASISVLGGSVLHSMEVYTMLVFKSFHLLDSDERQQHLMYIRDNLFSDAKHEVSRYRCYNTAYERSTVFLSDLRQLKCLFDSKTDCLLPISQFSDPRVPVFQLFEDNFKFPSEEYRGGSWLDFFTELGLKTELESEEFLEFCDTVANDKHPELYKASYELLKYLFSKKAVKWRDNASLLEEIGNIHFVIPDPLDRLSWIKALCSPSNRSLQLTTLRGAAVSSCARLVWTVMPVVNVPYYNTVQLTLDTATSRKYHEFLAMLGLITEPCVEDVYKNIINISTTGLANFQLFVKHKPEYSQQQSSGSQRDGIVQVVSENLSALKDDTEMLKKLEMVACIPVDAESEDTVSKPVLVNSLQVVNHIPDSEQCFQPYISVLPSSMNSLSKLLAEVGVTAIIEIKHLQYMLQVIHDQTSGNPLHANRQLAVRSAVLKLLHLCSSSGSDELNSILTKLYLPCQQGTLMLSTKIIVKDSKRYQLDQLDFSKTDYNIFRLPQGPSYQRNWPTLQDKNLLDLPEAVRPHRLVLSCEESIVNETMATDEQTPLFEQIKRMKSFHNPIKTVLRLLLLQSHNAEEKNIELFVEKIGEALKTLEVKLVRDLKANVCLTLVEPPISLGSTIVPFILTRNTNGSFILYLNTVERSRESSKSFWNDFSQHLCIQVAKHEEKELTAFFKYYECLAECLKVKNRDDLQVLIEDLSVELNFDEQEDSSTEPKLGRDIPPRLLALLDQDINNIFRPQEWVGYEIQDGWFVFAIVLNRVPDQLSDCGSPVSNFKRRYKILVSDREPDGKVVSALDLYKIIENYERSEEDEGKEMVHYDVDSTAVAMNNAACSQKILQLKRDICRDLREVWQLSDNDRRRAIRRLYFKYHPDKAAESEKILYEEAWKFLKRQIDRLENGLELEDPGEMTEGLPPHSKWWSWYSSWDDGVYRWRGGGGGGGGGGYSFYRPKPDHVEARRWLRQAEADCLAMRVMLNKVHNVPQLACNICFMAHQVVEKSLKAGMYRLVGINPSYLHHHSLCGPADAMWTQVSDYGSLHSIASKMEKEYLDTRYPNRHAEPRAPVDVYTADEADEMARDAEKVINIIRNVF